MVHSQANAVEIGLPAGKEEAPGGDVHADHILRLKVLRGPEGRGVDLVAGRDIRVVEEPGGLAQLPQGGAQSGGTADGVAVRAAVGQDQDVVLPGQQRSCLPRRHRRAHASSPRTMCSLAGLAGLTTSGLRSISKICAPCSMESSAMNCSSGV